MSSRPFKSSAEHEDDTRKRALASEAKKFGANGITAPVIKQYEGDSRDSQMFCRERSLETGVGQSV